MIYDMIRPFIFFSKKKKKKKNFLIEFDVQEQTCVPCVNLYGCINLIPRYLVGAYLMLNIIFVLLYSFLV